MLSLIVYLGSNEVCGIFIIICTYMYVCMYIQPPTMVRVCNYICMYVFTGILIIFIITDGAQVFGINS